MLNKDEFFSSDKFVIFGVSPRRKTFATYVKKCLEKSEYEVYAVNPEADNGFYHDLKSLPVKVEAVIIATKPANTLKIIDNLTGYGISKIWLQSGSFDDEVISHCLNAGIKTYTGCIIMYMPGTGFIHRFHRFIHDLIERRR